MSESFASTLRLLRLATIVESESSNASRRWARVGSMSQNELARRARIDPAFVQRLEKGTQSAPSRAVVERLSAALGLGELLRARLLVAAGYWPWVGRGDDEIEKAVAVAAAIMRGDYRPLHEPEDSAMLEPL
jgi:transcriptional regulator with XRE-family HTH domain